MNIKIPNEVRYIIDTLENDGFEAYAVGGCVRDSLLCKEPQDWDICTPALPERTMKCFEGLHIIQTGLKHGTVTLMLSNRPFEITTYRADGKYKDNRRPDKVKFVDHIKRDLARRDFTVNAMAYNPARGLVDFYGGAEDLKAGVIKCVGNADKRFQEDALRIMRALRFASELGFTIDGGTSAAMHSHKKLLNNISAERIAGELNKLIAGSGAGSVLLSHLPVITEIIPELIIPIPAAGIDGAPKDTVIRLAVLFCDIGEDTATEILSRLKYDTGTIKAVTQLVLYNDAEIKGGPHIKRLLNQIGRERFRQLIEVKKANAAVLPADIRQSMTDALNGLLLSADGIIAEGQCFSLKDLAVNGRDLIAAGTAEGAAVGVILNRLLDMVIDGEAENDKEVLLEAAKKMENGKMENGKMEKTEG